MAFGNPILDVLVFDVYQTLLPDFLIAFAFFTAVIFAVMGRRFGSGRPAVVVSAAMGMALSVGLVWWEYTHGISMRQLGPIAVGFALLLLAGVLYQAIKSIGGNWAGGMLALGVCILIGWLVGLNWSIDARVLQSITTTLLTIGILAFLLHRRGVTLPSGRGGQSESADIRHDMTDLYDDQRTSDWLGKGLRDLKKKAKTLHERPREASDVTAQLRRMLPAEGWLTEQLARLRERARHFRVGHVTQIEGLRKQVAQLPVPARRKAASELAALYKELRFDERVERLDRAVAVNEQRIRQLTAVAQEALSNRDQRKLVDLLDQAGKLQKHNSTLLRAIRRTESHMENAARKVAQKAGGVKAQ